MFSCSRQLNLNACVGLNEITKGNYQYPSAQHGNRPHHPPASFFFFFLRNLHQAVGELHTWTKREIIIFLNSDHFRVMTLFFSHAGKKWLCTSRTWSSTGRTLLFVNNFYLLVKDICKDVIWPISEAVPFHGLGSIEFFGMCDFFFFKFSVISCPVFYYFLYTCLSVCIYAHVLLLAWSCNLFAYILAQCFLFCLNSFCFHHEKHSCFLSFSCLHYNFY